jgi:ribonuclease HII
MSFEAQYLKQFPVLLVASDEAGRGPLAGPVVAASVAVELADSFQLQHLTSHLHQLRVNDSKQLSAKARELLAQHSWRELGIISALVEVSAREIDSINILQASLLAMRQSAESCVAQMKKSAVVWLIDGNRRPTVATDWNVYPIVKGDARSSLIGLASILAKVHRDELMKKFHQEFPLYGFDQHAGYPTALHREKIRLLGPSPIHRRTFKGVREYC